MNDCLELMRKLIEYRQQKALHHQLMKVAERSMLGIDAIVMLYHCAKISAGDILEVGAYIGGATIAIAMGVRDSGMQKKVISIQRGGRVDLPRIGTKDSFKDVGKNLKRFGFLDQVTLINARSFEPDTIAMVHRLLGPREIGLFVFDADANVRRDLVATVTDLPIAAGSSSTIIWVVPRKAESCECKWTSWSAPGDWSHLAFTVSEHRSVDG